MNIPFKKITAILITVALSAMYFMACGVKEEKATSSEDVSSDSSESGFVASSEDESSNYPYSYDSETDKTSSYEESFTEGISEDSIVTDSSITDITKIPDNSEESDMENSKPSNITESSETIVEESSVQPDDSSVTLPDDSSVTPPDDSSVTPPDDSSVTPPDDSSVTPPDDSSEESIYIPKDPSDPLTPIPEALYADPIDSHFNSSVFLGYSIMMHFGRYIGQWRTQIDSSIMGNSINVGAVGISFWSNSQQSPSMPSNSLPRYRGVAYNFEDLPAATGCNTMYIGLTCYSEMKVFANPKSAADEVIKGVKSIQEKNPGVTIVLLSGTYNTGTFEQLGAKYSKKLSNENIRNFNNYVLDYCNQNGVDFVDVSTPLTNGYGYMPIEYSSDNDYHIAKDAFLIWIDVLRDYARKKEAGTWQNPTVMPELGM